MDEKDIMNQENEFNHLNDLKDGIFRELAPGITTSIFTGEHVMLSVVTMEPNSEGVIHQHPPVFRSPATVTCFWLENGGHRPPLQ